MKRGFESWFKTRGGVQASQLEGGVAVIAFLAIRINQIFDRMAELVPDELTFITGGIFECRIGRAQVSANAAVPIAEPRVEVRRHVDRVRIIWSNAFVLARDVE